ncbi:MAG: chloride channel protein [Bacteroidales bacterium]|jgi:CIC family chloride channel protein|nr:chloride channel protein [Bacteroidales bacterium]
MFQKVLTSFLVWRTRNISQQNFMLILAVVVGILAALAAVILKNLMFFVGRFIHSWVTDEHTNYAFLILPLIGILLTVFYIRKIAKEDDIGHGVSRVLRSISVGKGVLSRKKTYSSMIASSLTVGFGGSVGLEAPIVLTGSALGSNLGQILRLDYRSLVLLIGCGATGAIAGIFKAPIAGVVFALEVLMLDLTMASLIPLLISATTAALFAAFLMGGGVIFSFDITQGYVLTNVPFYILLGLLAGAVSIYFTKMNLFIETQLKKWKKVWQKALVGGLVVSALVYFFPPLFGEGFLFLTEIIQGNGDALANNSFFYKYTDQTYLFLGFILLILFFKVVAMAFTVSSGGVGGIFAPSLFMGGVTGFFLARLLNTTFGLEISEANFALAGMAGMMGGVMHAPLTAIFLIAEITGGYKLFVPLMITATLAYLLNKYFQPHSIYTQALAEKGELLTHDKDKAALSQLDINSLIETNFVSVPENGTLRNVVDAITLSDRTIFPVVDDEDYYLGFVPLNDIRDIIFKPALYDQIKVLDIIHRPHLEIQIDDTMESVAQKFRISEQYNIVVLDNGKYVGFLSRANVFSAYRKIMSDMSEE